MTQNSARQKGLIILSMPRSGSSWLASLSNESGTMGNADEWLDFGHLKAPKGAKSRPLINAQTLALAATPNGHFAIKIFPRQLLQVVDDYQFDFIRRARREHDTTIVYLEREDKVAQAISLVRAMQTGHWKSSAAPAKTARYNFGAIAQAYFHICRGYDFWRSYLALQGFAHSCYTYEALQQDPTPFLEQVARHFGQETPAAASPLTVQRDETTKAWRARFQADLEANGIPASAYQQKQPHPGLKNALKVLRGHPADIDRFGYSV